jgi:prepilin-type N-terminal cleavage/methylation domain-containing protein
MRYRRSTSISDQRGFTLVEIAIVLVVLALMIAGVLKGQEPIDSSRVRTLADTSPGARTAYLAFIDPYGRIPGDWAAAEASIGIGVPVTNPAAAVATSNNGRLDNPAGANVYAEPNAMWEQLSKAEFVQGSFPGVNAVPTSSNGLTPLNVFGAPIIVGRTSEYLDAVSPAPSQLHVYVGRFVPVSAMRELDVKTDDGFPRSGAPRATIATATTFSGSPSGWGGMDASCVATPASAIPFWNAAADSQDCNAVLMF